jgi:FkbM family methyltransferase
MLLGIDGVSGAIERRDRAHTRETRVVAFRYHALDARFAKAQPRTGDSSGLRVMKGRAGNASIVRPGKGLFRGRFFNPVLRAVFMTWTKLVRVITSRALDRLRISGTVELSVSGQELTMFSDWDDHFVDQLYFRPDRNREAASLRLFAAFASRSRVIMDVGANTGVYSILSATVNSKAAVHAFEPYPVNSRRLHENLELNGLTHRVRVMEMALGDGDDCVDFTVPANGQICDVCSVDGEFTRRHYRAWLIYETIQVRQMKLDSYCEAQELTSVDLVKVDVENYELSVLAGAVRTLDKHSPILLVEVFVDQSRRRFFDEVLRPLGYHPYLVTPDGLVRLDRLIEVPEFCHFLLSRAMSTDAYLPYGQMVRLVDELGRSQ